MNQLIGKSEIDQNLLKTMRTLGGCWAAYQNHDLGHRHSGHLIFLQIGPDCTFKTAPPRMPDTANAIGWLYVLVGYVDLELGIIDTTR
jgi:hypothetical protein